MAYFLCNFQGFPLRCAASAKLLKKLQFPSYNDAQHLLSGGVRSVFLAFPQIAQLPGFLLRRRELAVSTATLDARYCCFVNLLLFILLRPVLYNGPDADDAVAAVAPVTVDAASVIGRLLLLLVLPLACWLAVKSLC